MDDCKQKLLIEFDTEHSIVLGDYLDVLLNREDQNMERSSSLGKTADGVDMNLVYDYSNSAHDVSDEKITRLKQFEYALHAAWDESNQKCTRKYKYKGGIQTKGDSKAASIAGNYLILGESGIGKSTLAFQLAATCATKINNGIAIYFALDTTSEEIKNCMIVDNKIKINPMLSTFGDHNPSTLKSEDFKRTICKDNNPNSIEPQILMPVLSPRGITGKSLEECNSVFSRRFNEIENIIRIVDKYNQEIEAEKEYNQNNKIENKLRPRVKMVVIDSLNVFSDSVLGREQIDRLYALLKKYQIIGVFTLGESGNNDRLLQPESWVSCDTVDVSAAKFSADVVIHLVKDFYNDYHCTYLQVEKSRYVNNALGRHPYKIVETRNVCRQFEKENTEVNGTQIIDPFADIGLKKRLEVLPSLHYRIYGSEPRTYSKAITKRYQRNLFGIKPLDVVLPEHYRYLPINSSQIITISGASGLFKSDIAFNALVAGILGICVLPYPTKLTDSDAGYCENRKREYGMIVRFGDRDVFSPSRVRFEKSIFDELKRVRADMDETKTADVFQEVSGLIESKPHKYSLKCWKLKDIDKGQNNIVHLIEVVFKGGALLPEEFVEEICVLIRQFSIKRIVLADIKMLGICYPFLLDSNTSGKLFLSAFIHIMRNYRIHVILSSSESKLDGSAKELYKAEILSDAIIKCNKVKKNKDNSCCALLDGEGTIINHEKLEIHVNSNASDIASQRSWLKHFEIKRAAKATDMQESEAANSHDQCTNKK